MNDLRRLARRSAPASVRLALPLAAALTAASLGAIGYTEMFPVDTPNTISGACFHDGSLYAVAKGNVLFRLDPVTGEELAVVSPLLVESPMAHLHGMTSAGDGTFWVCDMHSQEIWQVRFSDYTVMSTVPAPPAIAYGLGYRDGTLWVGHHSAGTTTLIEAVDPGTGAILDTFDVGVVDNHGMIWLGCSLLVLDNFTDQVHRVSEAGELLESYQLPPVLPSDEWHSFAYDGSAFWIGNADTFYQFDLPVPPPPVGDVTGDHLVDGDDLVSVILGWGPCDPPPAACAADVDQDGTVGGGDLVEVILNWGACGE